MTELEKIEYAKSFIDKLANGVNPLDDTPIPEGDIVNHVRLSRCFFYVSGILQRDIERERRKAPKEKKMRAPFSLTPEQLENFEYSPTPISSSAMARKLNFLVYEEIDAKRMERFKQRKISQWMLDHGMTEYREWEHGGMMCFPTELGKEIGLVSLVWENYGRRRPVVFYSEEAQRFIIDNLEAIAATEIKKGKHGVFLEDDNENEGDEE